MSDMNQKKIRKKKGSGARTALIVLAVILLLLLAAGAFVYSRIGLIGKERLEGVEVTPGVNTGGRFQNVVIYGVDSREGMLTQDCHSDTIILCTLDKREREIRMASVYRDTYLDNTNGEYRKATECYFYGGPLRSINMLNKNLDLDLGDYITVNFNVVIEAVDLLGGIDLEITEEEMGYINGYCVENSAVTGVGYTPLSTYGLVHLDGIQALAYCRIRYTEGWDYKRTERQRTVLSLIFQKAKKKGLPTLLSLVNTLLPKVSTSMSSAELILLAGTMGSCHFGETTGFPFEKTATVVDGSDVVVPNNLAANVSRLHDFLFKTSGYEPSSAVYAISDTISSYTGIY